MKKLCIILFALAFSLNCYAADVKISDLTEVTSPTTSTAVLPVVDAGATKKVTIDNILKRGSLTQAYDTELAAIAGLTFDDKSIIQLTGAGAAAVLTCTAANQLLGVNSANDALECKSTINVLLDDSAAQFKDASDATKLVKINPTSAGTATITPTGAYELAYTLTGATTVTFPTTGTLAILGANTFTGNQTLDDGTGASPTLTFQDATNETAVFEKADAGFLTITTVAGDGVNIVTGNFKVGNGAPTQTQDGEDAYVEGMLEVDGVIYADGGITGATASDPYIKLDETDGTDWWIGIDDTGNSLEFRTNVTVGNTVRMELYESTGLLVTPPAAQTIAAGNTVAADACGTIKMITAEGAVTTATDNTFTAPGATNAGCCMDVINTGAQNITLDNNANFVSAGAADVVLGAGDTVRVCSTGASGKWYQIGPKGDN